MSRISELGPTSPCLWWNYEWRRGRNNQHPPAMADMYLWLARLICMQQPAIPDNAEISSRQKIDLQVYQVWWEFFGMFSNDNLNQKQSKFGLWCYRASAHWLAQSWPGRKDWESTGRSAHRRIWLERISDLGTEVKLKLVPGEWKKGALRPKGPMKPMQRALPKWWGAWFMRDYGALHFSMYVYKTNCANYRRKWSFRNWCHAYNCGFESMTSISASK